MVHGGSPLCETFNQGVPGSIPGRLTKLTAYRQVPQPLGQLKRPCPRGRCDRATGSAKGKAAGERVLRNAAFRRTGRPSLGDRQVLTLGTDSSSDALTPGRLHDNSWW